MAGPTLPQQLARLDQDRLRRYRDYLDFYEGKQWPGAPRRRERRVTVNYARPLVLKGVSYLLTGRKIAVDPPEDTDAGRALARRTEEALDAVWEANELDQLDHDTEVDAAVLGDGAYKVTWDAEEGRPCVTAPDVAGVFAWPYAGSLTRMRRVAQRWTGTADQVAEQLRRPVASRRQDGTVIVVEDWTADELVVWVDDQMVDRRPNPYGWIPYVLFRNESAAKGQWGVSDLAAIVEVQRELNRECTQLSGIMELSGNPIAALSGVSESEDIAVQPGAVWELPEGAAAQLIDLLAGGGVTLHVEWLRRLQLILHDLSETPRSAFGENPQGLSGVALNIELDPLLRKTERKRVIRSVTYRRRNELVLRLLTQFGDVDYAPFRTRVVWGEILPVDRSRQVDDEVKLIGAGVHSREMAADNLGVEDPAATFAQWRREELVVRGIGADETQADVRIQEAQ